MVPPNDFDWNGPSLRLLAGKQQLFTFLKLFGYTLIGEGLHGRKSSRDKLSRMTNLLMHFHETIFCELELFREIRKSLSRKDFFS